MKNTWSLNSYNGDKTKIFNQLQVFGDIQGAPSTHKNFTLLGLTGHKMEGLRQPVFPLVWVPSTLVTKSCNTVKTCI